MANDDLVMALQMAQQVVDRRRLDRYEVIDRRIEIQTSEEGMRLFEEALARYVQGTDPYRQEKPIQDDDQIIF